MKKIKYLFLLIMLLPINVFAVSAPDLSNKYTIKRVYTDLNNLGIDTSRSKSSSLLRDLFQISDDYTGSFPLFEVYSNDLHYHIYSLNYNNNSIDNNQMNISNNNKNYSKYEDLINKILINASKINDTNFEDISNYESVASSSSRTRLLNVISAQILIWEVTSDKRVNFDNVKCNSEFYNYLVEYNKTNTYSSNLNSLYTSYSNLINNISDYEKNANKNSESNPYKLYYNVKNNRYQNVINTIDETIYTIKNDTDISLTATTNGMMAYVPTSKYFTDIKNISLTRKEGSTNADLEKFYYFDTTVADNDYPFILASKSQKLSNKLYFTCAQGNFRLLTIEGAGNSVTGATYNIIDSNNNKIKFSFNNNSFNYSTDGTIEDIVINNSNSYTINELPDGEYKIIQTKVPDGSSFVDNEEDRTIKIKIEQGNFYTYNKVLLKYEINKMRIVRFTNYISKVFINESESTENDTYYITNSNGEKISLYQNKSKKIWQYFPISGIESRDELAFNTGVNYLSIYGLPSGSYTIHSNHSNSDRNITINNNTTYGDTIIISFDNKAGEILFYSTNENGKLLDGGVFKIQKITGETEEDVALTYDSTNDVYKIDEKGDEYTFTTKSGKAKISGATNNTSYKIIELTPPEGYQIFDENKAYVEVKMDSNNFVTSTPYILNRQIVATSDASSSAELILSIRTGNKVIKYGLIFLGISTFVILLLIIRKKVVLKK